MPHPKEALIQESLNLIGSGRSISSVAKSQGIPYSTLYDRVKGAKPKLRAKYWTRNCLLRKRSSLLDGFFMKRHVSVALAALVRAE